MKKLALITGASSGIGRELSIIHSQNGGNLILVARNSERLSELKKELQDKFNNDVYIIVKDLSSKNAAQEVYDRVKELNLNVDYLINNAGFGGQGNFYERDWNKDLEMINVNVLALTNLTRLFINDFVKNNSGRILNTSSSAALCPGPLQAVYFATKSYVTSFSNAIALELSETNVTVSTLMPGAVKTQFAKTSGMSNTLLFRRTSNPHEIALKGYNGMLKGKLDIIAGLSPLTARIMKCGPKKLIMRFIKKGQSVKS